MNRPEKVSDALGDDELSVHEMLLRLDLATEVLEGLDELGLESRSEVKELLTRLEAQIADST
jgi:hypothetical protein